MPPQGSPAAPRSSEIVLIHAPTGRDAALMQAILAQAGHPAETVSSIETLCARLVEEASVAILAEEALTPASTQELLDALAHQPSWSDLPLVVLTSVLAMQRSEQPLLRTLRDRGNVTLLERPVHPLTLLSAVHAGLRARRRQYEVRDYLLERSRTEERVREAQKMEAVGQLAGGVAHEVNNMMTVVIGYGKFALARLESSAETGDGVDTEFLRGEVEEMVKAGRRAAAITQQLLAFSRRQPRKTTLLSLQEVIPGLADLLGRLAGASIELNIRLSEDLPPIRADRTQLEQVIINLVINARDAITDFGTITVTGECVRADDGFAQRHGMTFLPDSRWVHLAVSDTGGGMDAATRERAFEPFFTTKPVGEGTGLGLATVYGIVKQSGGHVWLESEPGRGTTVSLYLPEAEDVAEEQPPGSPVTVPRGETVLVVEDEPVVRRLARTALEEAGYSVMEAGDGVEALKILTATDGQVDLVLSDVVMPRMGGRELNQALQRERPTLPMLFMSGYPGEDVTERGLLDPGASFIQKPFSPEELMLRVRRILDAGRPLDETRMG